MSKNVKFKVEKRSYPKNSAIVDIDVDDGVQEVTFGGDTCLDVDLYDVKKQFPDVKRLIIKNNIASISISNFMFPNVEDVGKALAKEFIDKNEAENLAKLIQYDVLPTKTLEQIPKAIDEIGYVDLLDVKKLILDKIGKS